MGLNFLQCTWGATNVCECGCSIDSISFVAVHGIVKTLDKFVIFVVIIFLVFSGQIIALSSKVHAREFRSC